MYVSDWVNIRGRYRIEKTSPGSSDIAKLVKTENEEIACHSFRLNIDILYGVVWISTQPRGWSWELKIPIIHGLHELKDFINGKKEIGGGLNKDDATEVASKAMSMIYAIKGFLEEI